MDIVTLRLRPERDLLRWIYPKIAKRIESIKNPVYFKIGKWFSQRTAGIY